MKIMKNMALIMNRNVNVIEINNQIIRNEDKIEMK